MREIRTSGSMSGEGRQSDCQRLKPPRPSSTLPLRFHDRNTLQSRDHDALMRQRRMQIRSCDFYHSIGLIEGVILRQFHFTSLGHERLVHRSFTMELGIMPVASGRARRRSTR